jgi:excinuclease ABC subunit C
LPDLLVIDGGKGQIGIAEAVLKELGVLNIPILGVAKGPTRKAGLEDLFIDGVPVIIDSHSPALHLIQHIRDEAHRFAIAGHRHKRGKAKRQSTLEGIDGIGPKRRRELIRFFGGIQEIKSASVDELVKVPGISQNLAQIIYDALHE